MSYAQLSPFTFTLTPVLRTREQIAVTVQVVVSGAGKYLLRLFIPFVALEPANDRIGALLRAEVESAINRWALVLASAEESLTSIAYESLTGMLTAIASVEFIIDQVVVQQIVPVTPRIEHPIPPPPAPPKKTHAEQLIEGMTETIDTLQKFATFEEACQKEHATLFDSDHAGTMLKNRFVDMKGMIINSERYR